MPSRCCVPGCKNNYDKTKREIGYVSVFLFPKELERRSLWLKHINRKNFVVTGRSAVCIDHFEERFIVREDKMTRADGSVLTVPRKRLKLTFDAFPSKFPSQPKYLSSKLPKKRRDPNERAAAIERVKNERKKKQKEAVLSSKDGSVLTVPRKKPKLTANAFPSKFPNQPKYLSIKLPTKRRNPVERAAAIEVVKNKKKKQKKAVLSSKDIISDYRELMDKSKISKFLDLNLISVLNVENSYYLLIKHHIDNGLPKIQYSVRVRENLDCDVIYKDCILNNKEIIDILGTDKKCDEWSKLEKLIFYVSSFHNHNSTSNLNSSEH